MSEVYKVQRPIVGDEMMFYNEDRSEMFTLPIAPNADLFSELFDKPDMPLKVYVELEVEGDALRVVGEAEEQAW